MTRRTEMIDLKTTDDQPSTFTRFFANLCPCFGKNHRKDKLYKMGETLTNNGTQLGDFTDNKHQESFKVEERVDKSQSMLKTASFAKYDEDVEEYFYKTAKSNTNSYQYISLQRYQSDKLFLIGSIQKVFFVIHTKVLSMSSKSAEKTKQSLDKTAQKPPFFINQKIQNMWKKRYLLFEKFDQGIKFDDESYISTPPQSLTTYLASRIRFNNLIHVFAGIGSYDIKLSNTCPNIITTDVLKTDVIQNNLSIYMVDNVMIQQNKKFLTIQNTKAEAILITPPWGSNYSINEQFDISEMNLQKLFSKALSICSNVIIVLPSNINTMKLADILSTSLYQQSKKQNKNCYSSCSFEIQKIFFMQKIRFIVVYYGTQASEAIKLSDELNMIYEILGADTFKCRKVCKYIRQLHGLTYLLNLCIEAQLTPGQTFKNFIKVIQNNKIIPDAKLKSFLDKNGDPKDMIKQNSSPEQIVPPQQIRCSTQTNTYTNSFASSIQIGSMLPGSINPNNGTRQTININCSGSIIQSIKQSIQPQMKKTKIR